MHLPSSYTITFPDQRKSENNAGALSRHRHHIDHYKYLCKTLNMKLVQKTYGLFSYLLSKD